MKLLIFVVTALVLQGCTAPPVTKNKTEDAKDNEIGDGKTGLEDYMEYHRYLREVVDALESDPSFREKLEKAQEADIRTGKIAHELEYVSHKVRTKLDELKRSEMERLRHLATRQFELQNGLGNLHDLPDLSQHLDHSNPHTFEIEDLKKLIAKTTQDLAEADKKRREEFKEYEMQKEFEKKESLKSLDDVNRAEMEKQIKEREEKHKKHKPLHHPGSKQQLEEVWEKQDHMDQQEFDPRTFFMLHDLDGNGVWDQDEVKSLFIKELDKMYQAGAAEDDMRERIEEMERMREHVFNEVDTNKDGLISYAEFFAQTQKQEFQKDEGWQGLDQQKVYSEEEYRQFEKQRLEEIERLIAQGMLPPHPGGPVYGQPQMPHQPGQFPPYHPGQVPPGYNQGQAQGYHPNQVPQQGQIPQQGYHPQGQVAQGYNPQGQIPQQVYHPDQNQVPPAQVYHQQGYPQGVSQGQPPQANQQGSVQGQQVQGNAQLNTNEVYPNLAPQVPQQGQAQAGIQSNSQHQAQPVQNQQPVQNPQTVQNLQPASNNQAQPPPQNVPLQADANRPVNPPINSQPQPQVQRV